MRRVRASALPLRIASAHLLFADNPARPQFEKNQCQDTFKIRHYFLVPESQHTITMFSQQASSALILLRLLSVLGAVGLDGKTCDGAREIRDKFADRELTSELNAVDLSVA